MISFRFYFISGFYLSGITFWDGYNSLKKKKKKAWTLALDFDLSNLSNKTDFLRPVIKSKKISNLCDKTSLLPVQNKILTFSFGFRPFLPFGQNRFRDVPLPKKKKKKKKNILNFSFPTFRTKQVLIQLQNKILILALDFDLSNLSEHWDGYAIIYF